MLGTLPDQGFDGPCQMRQSRRAGALAPLGTVSDCKGKRRLLRLAWRGKVQHSIRI